MKELATLKNNPILHAVILISIISSINKKFNEDITDVDDLANLLEDLCMACVLKEFPVPYGVYINLALGICQQKLFKDKSVKTAAILLTIMCSSAKHIEFEQFKDLKNAMVFSGTTQEKLFKDSVNKAILDINESINDKIKED